MILFDGTSLAAWRTDKGEAPKWKVENGYMEVVKGVGDILTREEFGDSQLHIFAAGHHLPNQGKGQKHTARR